MDRFQFYARPFQSNDETFIRHYTAVNPARENANIKDHFVSLVQRIKTESAACDSASLLAWTALMA